MNEKIKPYLKSDGKLPKYMGGYPMYYVSRRNSVLCPDCANEDLEDEDDPPVDGDANWEDPSLFCEECNERIESAYAEDEVGKENQDA